MTVARSQAPLAPPDVAPAFVHPHDFWWAVWLANPAECLGIPDGVDAWAARRALALEEKLAQALQRGRNPADIRAALPKVAPQAADLRALLQAHRTWQDFLVPLAAPAPYFLVPLAAPAPWHILRVSLLSSSP